MLALSHIVNSVYNSVTWIIEDNSNHKAIIIDCGDAKPLLEYLNGKNLSLVGIFLTHTHYDHIYGLNDVVDIYPNSVIYTSENGKKSLANSKYNLARYQAEIGVNYFEYSRSNVVVLKDGDKIPFGSKFIEVLNTEGHDWSCLSYIIDEWFFTGDSYIPWTKLVYNFPKSDKQKAAASKELILDLARKRNLKILCGHERIM